MFKTLKTLLAFQWKYKLLFSLSTIFTIIMAVVDTIIPYFLQQFIDTVNSQQFEKLIPIALFYLLTVFLGNFLEIFVWVPRDANQISTSRDIRLKIFKHVQSLDFAYHRKKHWGFNQRF